MINATKSTQERILIPSDTYLARCYSMVHIGTVIDQSNGEEKSLNKVRISWELSTETRVFKEGEAEQPFVISKEYTLSLSEKANLRKMLESWRGAPFTENECKGFDVSKLIGVPCMLGVIHITSKAGKVYADVSTVTKVMKGLTVPAQINPSFLLSYDNFDFDKFKTLPDFIKDRMILTPEYKALTEKLEGANHEQNLANAEPIGTGGEHNPIDTRDLPF